MIKVVLKVTLAFKFYFHLQDKFFCGHLLFNSNLQLSHALQSLCDHRFHFSKTNIKTKCVNS